MSLENNFKWTGERVDCYNPILKNKKCIFYTSFILNDESFLIGDFAIIDEDCKESDSVCRLLCVYESKNTRHTKSKYMALIRRYTWAKDIQQFKSSCISFDKNEVVEDYNRFDFFINLEHIKRKCYVIFSTLDDPVDLISLKQLDKTLYFVCRYKLQSSKLIAYFSNESLKQLNSLEYTPITQVMKQQTKTPQSNYYTTDSSNEIIKNKSQNKKIKNNSVKRNLNISFGEADVSNDNLSILNYSVVKTDNSDNESLKLRLIVSSKQPVVMLEKLSLEKMLTPKKSVKNDYSNENSIRRSSRRTRRISYAELFSPTLYETPTKRIKQKSEVVSLKRSNKDKAINDKSSESSNKSNSKYVYYESSESEDQIEEAIGKRKIKSRIKYQDEIYSSPIRLHRNSIKKTPTRQKLDEKSFKSTPNCSRAKLIREGLITPSMQSRKHAINVDKTPLMLARTQLHVSFVPGDLPCREKEFSDIYTFLESKLLQKSAGCMYISGVPGTGKTATSTSVINHLLEMSKEGNLPKFQYVSINGMKLTEPRQAYVEILKQLTGKTVSKEQAQTILEEKFTKLKTKQLPVVLLVDELDIICTKRQDVVYNLLDWPTKAYTQLVVITIANTMDLPERLLMSRVTSRLGLTRLTFQAYTHKQLQEIVTRRLMGNNSFNSDAIQFVARKVASVSGDARRALDICRRSAENAELQEGNKNAIVTISHVNEALKIMLTQPKVCAIKSCSKLEKFILQAVVAEVERTGVEEITFADAFKMLVSISALNGFRIVTSTIALGAVAKLCSSRLLLNNQKNGNFNQRIILNISPDDVYYALKEIQS